MAVRAVNLFPDPTSYGPSLQLNLLPVPAKVFYHLLNLIVLVDISPISDSALYCQDLQMYLLQDLIKAGGLTSHSDSRNKHRIA